MELSATGRRLRVDGREVPPRAYQGRLEVIVYSTERLKVVRGPMRERRLRNFFQLPRIRVAGPDGDCAHEDRVSAIALPFPLRGNPREVPG